MEKKKEYWNKKYLQEIIIFIAMFILTMLHEWILIDSLISFAKAFVFFALLYIQAQMNRIFIFPFFLRKKISMYFLMTGLITLFGAFILFLANYFWVDPSYYQKENIFTSFIYFFVVCLVTTLTIMTLSLMQRYSLEIQKRNYNQLQLNKMNIRFLSSQLNPHFFFNMLNNLYGVSLTQPHRTANLILKISELMRYQIKSVSKNQVKLSEELMFIKNYIDLEKERTGKRCKITFTYPHSERLELYTIAPLLLIIIIENSFSHSITNKDWFVNILIDCEDNNLKVVIQNSLPNLKLAKKSTGIGLMNIRQRLDFLYKGKYKISNFQNENSYQTVLNLELKKQDNE